MFQFPPFALTLSLTDLQSAGLPHSDISGSKPVCSYPELVAAYHVLHRLQKPRHPPSALVTFSLFFNFDWMNHKNFMVYKNTLFYLHLFSFTRCLEIAVHNFTIDSLFLSLLVTDFLKFHLLTLPRYLFSNLSMNYRFFSNGLQRYDFFLYLQIFLHFFLKKMHFFFKNGQFPRFYRPFAKL